MQLHDMQTKCPYTAGLDLGGTDIEIKLRTLRNICPVIVFSLRAQGENGGLGLTSRRILRGNTLKNVGKCPLVEQNFGALIIDLHKKMEKLVLSSSFIEI